MNPPALLEGRFSLGLKSKRIFAVAVRHAEIQCIPETGTENRSHFKIGRGRKAIDKRRLSMYDIIGCDCRKNDVPISDTAAYLIVCAYVANRKSNSTDDNQQEMLLNCRKRSTLTINFNHYPVYDQNLEEAMKWRTVIICLTMKVKINPNTGQKIVL